MILFKQREDRKREKETDPELRIINTSQIESYDKKLLGIVSVYTGIWTYNTGGFLNMARIQKTKGGSYPSILEIPKNKGGGS